MRKLRSIKYSKIRRRNFLKMIPFGLGMSLQAACDRLLKSDSTNNYATSQPEPNQTSTQTPESMIELPELKKIEFGNTGLKVSPLAFGTGTRGVGGHSDQSALGIEKLAELLVQGYDNGVNFWDSADAYGTHPHLARALQTVPRDGVVILTKTMSRDGNRVSRDIDRFLVELTTDVIDIVLMHCITPRDWTARYEGAMLALSRAKEQGKVRAVGVSCHSTAALDTATRTGWTDVVMARVNYAGVNMDASPEKVEPLLAEIFAAGKAVVGMKGLGVGRLGNDPRGAMDYVFGLGTVHAITIGMQSRDELLENIRAIGEFV
jgi:predicted aldo/keto reductase-like oxidoreductase